MKLESRTSSLQELYADESARIRKRFEETGDGKAADPRPHGADRFRGHRTVERSHGGGRSDRRILHCRHGRIRAAGIVSVFGHRSSISLCEGKATRNFSARKLIAPLSQALWDLHLRVSPTTRTLAECGKLHRNNIEFNISLLDCRYICGDEKLYERLRTRVLPGMVMRESETLMQELTGLARARHQKYGETIFHLEPNIKDGPAACATIKWPAGLRKSRK